jgi:hypothetical protein
LFILGACVYVEKLGTSEREESERARESERVRREGKVEIGGVIGRRERSAYSQFGTVRTSKL